MPTIQQLAAFKPHPQDQVIARDAFDTQMVLIYNPRGTMQLVDQDSGLVVTTWTAIAGERHARTIATRDLDFTLEG